ncbi:Major facilitator superfamily multidrug transporter mfsB [Pseudocercospora fuligena]|uniref:Major facilitator superfamily multidrug transporter mfsB n=1 Tax=Pseudocercospora fuligena TaxID=685502 RepID=A0A8H6RQW0_9PEZI|nr:Major facilitator superfamily multidrug transporter mfsB [Pseudocercospora fuligena]
MDTGRGHGGHNRTDTVDTVDSAATTLLGSPHPNNSDRKYASIELDRFETDQEIRKRKKSIDSHDEHENEEDTADEEERLLAQDTAQLNHDTRIADTAREADDDAEPPPGPSSKQEKRQAVAWKDLPKKGQLAILTLARLSEPLTQTSLQSYMFYQLKSFKAADGSTPSDSTVSQQAGLLAAAFTGAQFCTAILWGRLADSEKLGRKRVILIGLLGTAIGALGFGFSQSFAVAMFWRAVGGILNGNIGVMRTMISEIVKEKKYQGRAFLLLPMTFNIGVIIGPLLGGLLADPAGSYPHLFGPGSTFGGEHGVPLFMRFPYALPNIVNATFLLTSAFALVLGLEETLDALKGKNDWGLKLGKLIARVLFRRRSNQDYTPLHDSEHSQDLEHRSASMAKPKPRQKLPFRRIWTRNVLLTFLAHGLLAMHVGTFNNLWFVFLSTPRYSPDSRGSDKLPLPKDYKPHAPFTFTGGLALPPPAIGMALAILGVLGISLQLLIYPRVQFRLGTITAYRLSLLLFPISYFLAPFLAIVPSTLPPPHQAAGAAIWIAITFVLVFQVTARTFALPSTAILINNCCPHPSVLGSIHGIGQSVSSLTRTIGPVMAGWAYGLGLNAGFVGLAWWGMCGISIVGAVAGTWVKEGDGHEIWLEGEKEEEDSSKR